MHGDGPMLCSVALILTLAQLPDTQVPQDPILTVDPGRHTIPVGGSFDESGTWMVTCGWDGEIRVWLAKTGELFRTIRQPVGRMGEGQVKATCITGDGSLVITATLQYAPWNKGHGFAFYVFDRATGRMIERCVDVPGPVLSCSTTRTGDRVALSLADGSIVFYARGKGTRRLATLKPSGAPSYSVAFEPSGQRAVASSYDGHLSLFSRDGVMLHRVRARSGTPIETRFSPDGRLIVAGGNLAQGLEIYDGKDLRYLRTESRSGLSGLLDIPAWSWDGKYVAGGMSAANKKGEPVLRVWGDQGKGTPRDIVIKTGIECVGRAPGGFMVTDHLGRFLRVTPQGEITPLGKNHQIASSFVSVNRPKPSTSVPLYANADLSKVVIRLMDETQFLSYDLRSRKATILRSPLQLKKYGLFAPLFSHGNVTATSQGPLVGGRPLTIPYLLYQWAVSPDEKKVAVATLWCVSLYSAEGALLWRVPVPMAAHGVIFSQDSKTLAAFCNDGTIGWFRVADGKRLLSCFVQPGTMDWIVWTPREGFYDCSPFGENFANWQIFDGPDQAAKSVPIRYFRNERFRPDVIDQVLDHSAVDRAAAATGVGSTSWAARIRNAPQVSVSLATYTAQGTLKVRADTEPGGRRIATVELSADGVLLESLRMRGAKVDTERQVASPPSTVNVSIRLDNGEKLATDAPVNDERLRSGNKSAPPKLIRFTGPKRMVIIAVGVNKAGSLPQLSSPEADASAFAKALQTSAPNGTAILPFVLLGSKSRASRQGWDELHNTIHNLKPPLGAEDMVVTFLAGHGIITQGQYAFPLQNYDPIDTRTWLTAYDLAVVADPAGYKVAVVDTCSAGALLSPSNTLLLSLISPEHNYCVFFACRGGAVAGETNEHGVFTASLLEAIQGSVLARQIAGQNTFTTIEGGNVTLPAFKDLCDSISNIKVKTKQQFPPVLRLPRGIEESSIVFSRWAN